MKLGRYFFHLSKADLHFYKLLSQSQSNTFPNFVKELPVHTWQEFFLPSRCGSHNHILIVAGR